MRDARAEDPGEGSFVAYVEERFEFVEYLVAKFGVVCGEAEIVDIYSNVND